MYKSVVPCVAFMASACMILAGIPGYADSSS